MKIVGCDRPVPLAHLDFIQLQAHKFRSAKTTTKQQGQHGVVALRSHAISTSTHLSTSELSSARSTHFPERNPSCLTPFTRLIPAANSGLSKPESAASVCEAAHGGQLLVDGWRDASHLDHPAFFSSVATTRSLKPDPHRETTLTACVKGTFSGMHTLG